MPLSSVHEFETQPLDSDDPNEVEVALIAATNYYEKPEPSEVENVTENAVDNRREMFNWIFSKYEILDSESTLR